MRLSLGVLGLDVPTHLLVKCFECRVIFKQFLVIRHGFIIASFRRTRKFVPRIFRTQVQGSLREYWLYPCIFEETFCLTALEAAISKTCVISNNLAALSETVCDRGIITHGDPRSKEWQEECLTKLFEVMESEKLKNECVNLNYQWAKKLTWESQANKFLNIVEK